MECQIATCSLVSGLQTRRESARFYALPLAAIADQSNHDRLALNRKNTACHVLDRPASTASQSLNPARNCLSDPHTIRDDGLNGASVLDVVKRVIG